MDKISTNPAVSAFSHGPAISTLAARVYASLVEQIVSGALPPGHRLEEKVLANRFGVSRTPIREALRELWARKLVELLPRRGGVVAQIGIETLTDMLEAECEIEGLCARLASLRMSSIERRNLEELLDRMGSLLQQSTLADFFDLNKEFHDLICQGAHNATLMTTANDLRFELSPFRRPQLESDETRIVRSHREHSLIVQAIVAGRSEQAYDAVRAHNSRVNSGVLQVMRLSIAKP